MTALFLATYMFVGSLFPQTDFGQLTKIGNVFKHYKIHKAEAELNREDVSFLGFLKLHYLQPAGHDEDSGHDHDSLPLLSLNSSFSFTHHFWALSLEGAVSFINVEQSFFYAEWLLRDYTASLFHPPSFS